MSRKPAKPKDNSAAVALQFGISLKALRHYEQLGLLAAPRTAELFRSGPTDLSALLAVQAELLSESRREIDHTLTLIQVARERVATKSVLSAEELSALVRKISRTVIRMTPELEDLARRVYTPEQAARLNNREQTPKEAARISAFWERVAADIGAMLPDGDPLSRKGLAIARRVTAFIAQSTRGDAEMWNNAARFWQQAVSDPQMSKQLPMSKPHWDFMAKAMTELKRRGELKY